MHVCFTRICTFLFLSVSMVCAEEIGGYSASIALSQNVPLENGIDIIKKMVESLKDASKILHSALGLQFSKVTFEIPESLDTSELKGEVKKVSTSPITKPDILIDNTDDLVFGKFPFAQQYGSCGLPGHQIIVPTVFFHEDNSFPKGLLIAREWLKYRYGVFDENGYFGDPLYPSYYHIGGGNKVHITDCTNTKIAYNFMTQEGKECSYNKMLIDKLNKGECGIHVKNDTLENVTSSFMYFQENISRMTHICGRDADHQHNSRSPNKQNLLCFGKSIWDIVSESSDIRNKKETKELSDIEFVFLQKIKPRVVVAWENTQKMKSKGEIILNAITKFMIDLPNGSKFSAFPFTGSMPEKKYEMSNLNEVKDRQDVASDIKSDFQKDEDVNYKDAMLKAFEILNTTAENDDEPYGNIITVTGTADELFVILLTDLHACSSAMSYQLKLLEIILTIPDDIKQLESQACLEVERFSKADKPEETFKNLVQTMGRLCPSIVEDKHTEKLELGYLENAKALSVEVDDLTESVAFFIFSQQEKDSFELKLDGETVEKEDVTQDVFGNVFKLSYSTEQAGKIDLSYRHNTLKTPLLTQIQKTSKAGKYFTGEVVVQDTTVETDSSQMPVIIYAIVRFGSYPVQNAVVSATIAAPDGRKTQLKLKDDGLGDPDITKNDGVYSRYFTNFSRKGIYMLTVEITNKESTTTYGADKTAGYSSCCGSSVKNGTSKLSHKFVKIFKEAFKAISGRPEDGYKPSRITDLRVDKVEEDGLTLKWTAPGEEADSGTASRYAIKLFCGEENTTECDILEEAIQIMNISAVKDEKEQLLKIKIVNNTLTLSIAIVALNAKNKTSELSNRVEIFRPGEEIPDDPTPQGSKTATIVGSVIGGILIIACILAVAIYLIKKQKKTSESSCEETPQRTYQRKDIYMKTRVN